MWVRLGFDVPSEVNKQLEDLKIDINKEKRDRDWTHGFPRDVWRQMGAYDIVS